MEWRFFVGYMTGAGMLYVLQHLDTAWWIAAILAFVGYGLAQGVTHQLFDK